MTIKVLLADDHGIVREGVALILEKQKDIKVIGVADDGREAVQLVAQLHPDVVVFDISMPQLNGIEAARQVTKQHPSTRVIILSMHATAEHIHGALRAGACCYVLKESAGKEIVSAIHAAAKGRHFVSPKVSDMVLQDYAHLKRKSKVSPVESLSFREREILQLVVEEKSSKEIATMIHLSPKTVESYRSRLMTKLGVAGIAGLVKFAIANGLTTEG